MAGMVYLLCALTSLVCAVLLFRGYGQSGVRLLFWSGLCFVGLAVDNVAVYVDLVVYQDIDHIVLRLLRLLPGLVALTLLLFGLIWEKK